MKAKTSFRFTMTGPNGETFIMYGRNARVRASAKARGYTDVKPAGHYDYRTNTIIGGDSTIYCDERKAPGA